MPSATARASALTSATSHEARAVTPHPVLGGTDSTTEALLGALAASGGRLPIAADEGSGVDRFLGHYSGRSNTGPLNSAMDERRVQVVRRNVDANVTIERPSLTFALLAQPNVLTTIREDADANTGGFTPRFLWVVPPDPGASVPGHERPTLDPVTRKRWGDLLCEVAAVRDATFDATAPRSTSARVTFDGEAADLFRGWESLVRAKELHALNAAERSWRAKHPGRVASIAGVLHVARHGGEAATRQVSAVEVATAIAIGDTLADHASVAIGGGERLDSDRTAEMGIAEAVLAWAKDRNDPYASFTSSDFRRSLSGTMRSRWKAVLILGAFRQLAASEVARVDYREERGKTVATATLYPGA